MKIYINKHKELVLAPEKYEKFGGVSNETIQIKNGEFAKEIEKGMTKKELAEKAGISKNTIQNIRNSKISFRNMVKIADALDVSLDEFRKDNT